VDWAAVTPVDLERFDDPIWIDPAEATIPRFSELSRR
jgi:hypothetical protein